MAMTLPMAYGFAIGILAFASSGIAAIGGLTGRPPARSGLSPKASLVFARTGVTTQVRSMLRCYSNSSIHPYVVAGCNNVHGCASTGAPSAAPLLAHNRFQIHG